jgi:metal-sulfur cluster biosynthetic enzyme
MVSREAVIEALRQVQEPELRQDLITLKMVRDIKVEGNALPHVGITSVGWVGLLVQKQQVQGQVDQYAAGDAKCEGAHPA